MSNTQKLHQLTKILKTKKEDLLQELLLIDETGDAVIDPFDEQAASKRIASAMIDDAVTGKNTADNIRSQVDKDRTAFNLNQKEAEKRANEARSNRSNIEHALQEIELQITEAITRFKNEVNTIADAKIEKLRLEYVQAANLMFEKAAEIYGLMSLHGTLATSAFNLMKMEIPGADADFSGSHFHKAFGIATSTNHSEAVGKYRNEFLIEIVGESYDWLA